VGFTLVELLMCVAVIGLLLGMTLPVLGRSRMASWNAGCLARLRGLSVGTELYSNQYRSVPVWATTGAVRVLEIPGAAWWCPADRVRPGWEDGSSYSYLALLYMGPHPDIAVPASLDPRLAMRRYEDNPYLPLYWDAEERHPHRNVAFWDGVVRRWWE
jgi:prepilin-type N-terminal cleavage/methylation domain-containing protein/prepilin-type processing-associated H-X9-DG protein